MTIGINNDAYACAFDSGPIHAYGLRESVWDNNETDIELIYSGTKYDGNAPEIINRVVYKYIPSSTFNITTRSYIWFFTRTPRDEGVAALNAP